MPAGLALRRQMINAAAKLPLAMSCHRQRRNVGDKFG